MKKSPAKIIDKKPVIKPRLPGGILLIIIVTLIGFFSYVMAISAKSAFVFGYQLYGPTAIAFGVIAAAISASIIYGLYKITPWAYKLTIGFTIFEIINGLVNMFFSNRLELGLTKFAMPILIASGVIFDALVIWYLSTKKAYFLRKKEKNHHDKLFVRLGLGIVLLGILLTGILIYIDIVEITKLNQVARDLIEGKDITSAMVLCEDQGDYCFMAIASLNKNNTEAIIACDKIIEPAFQSACGSMFAITHNNSIFCETIKDPAGASFCKAAITKDDTFCKELVKKNEINYCYDYIKR